MAEHSDRRRRRRRSIPRSPDAPLLCMATAAASCVLAALAIVVFRPGWDSQVLELPLGAYLLGGVGGLLTTAALPSWSRRLEPRAPARVVVITAYRLLCSCLMGGMGFAVGRASLLGSELSAPEALLYTVSLVSGCCERPLNMGLLGVLGFLAPREVKSRLL